MNNHNKAQQSKNRVHISWDILYLSMTYSSNFTSYGIRKYTDYDVPIYTTLGWLLDCEQVTICENMKYYANIPQ